MHAKPCRAGLPIFPLIIVSLDDFCCLAIDSQATTHFFYKPSLTFSIFTHVHTTWSPPLTQGCHHPPHSIGTPLHHPLLSGAQPLFIFLSTMSAFLSTHS